jgi:hypothetical protein
MPFPSQNPSNQALNEVLVILSRSLPMYLSDAAPWAAFGEEHSQQVLAQIVADKTEAVRRLTSLLDDRRQTVDRGEFPMDYTGLHDVSLDYLMDQLVGDQRREVEAIESRLGRLSNDPLGRALVNDIAAAARRHLKSLESLAQEPAAAKPPP